MDTSRFPKMKKPDPEIDARIVLLFKENAFPKWSKSTKKYFEKNKMWRVKDTRIEYKGPKDKKVQGYFCPPPFTSCVATCIELVEHLLPDAEYTLNKVANKSAYEFVIEGRTSGYHKLPQYAILNALIKRIHE